MALKLSEKKAVVAEVSHVAETAHSAIAAEYRGLTVVELTELRKQARDAGVTVRVVKNTLARKALANTRFACMDEGLTGPLMLAFSLEDPAAAARIVRSFGKQHNKLIVRLVAVGGKVFGPADLNRLADLPNREQALSMLLAVMKAPIGKFVRTLAEPHAKLVRTLDAVRQKKQVEPS